MKLILTQEHLEMGVAELDEYGLAQREINFLEGSLGCLYVKELVQLRPRQICDADRGGPGVLKLIQQAVVNLAAGHRVTTREELDAEQSAEECDQEELTGSL